MTEKRKGVPTEQIVWLSLEEAAVSLGETQWTVLRWAKDGNPRLPGYKVWDENAGNQGRFRFKKQDVEALISLGLAQAAAPAVIAPEPVARAVGSKRAAKA